MSAVDSHGNNIWVAEFQNIAINEAQFGDWLRCALCYGPLYVLVSTAKSVKMSAACVEAVSSCLGYWLSPI